MTGNSGKHCRGGNHPRRNRRVQAARGRSGPAPDASPGDGGPGRLSAAGPRFPRGAGRTRTDPTDRRGQKASPSAKVIRADFDPIAIARAYQGHGAACLSVLTDVPYFQGHLSYLARIRASVAIPLLRKDFIIDEYQVVEARLAGADAILLIAEILDDETLARLLARARGLGMAALVEFHEEANLPRVLASGADLVGINNRDLRRFVTDLDLTLRLRPQIPPDVLLVSESGIRTHADVKRLEAAGVSAILVGESLMRADDIGLAVEQLLGLAPDDEARAGSGDPGGLS